MILFPAIDLRKGRCVRLRQGRPDEETVFGDNPAEVAQLWVAQGAQWLHVVNLDGAFGQEASSSSQLDLPINLQRLAEIRDAVQGTSLQFGGGVRSLSDVGTALRQGATRVVLGTVAVQEPAIVADAVQRFGQDRIVVGIDARDGRVATHGWQQTAEVTAVEVGRAMRRLGLVRAVYTDIARDGMLTGLNVEATVSLAQATGLRVIASGGVAGLRDLARLKATGAARIEGVIIGRALYTGAVTLEDALRLTTGG